MSEQNKLRRRRLQFSLMLSILFMPLPSFGQMADGQAKFVGNIIGTYVPASFDTYWNQVTPGNSGKWGSVESSRDVMVWTDLDKAYNHAMQHGYPFKQHTLIWGNQQPSWLSTLAQSEQAAEIEEWISAFAARYPNTQMIDVVNEPLHVVPSYVNAIGGSGVTGWDWVIWSFQKARAYCPNAKLLLNDYGILGSSKATSDYVKIINILKTRGLIDGIGVQGHGLEYAQSSTIQKNLNTLHSTGIPIYITELDLEHADDATQLGMYQRVFPLLYEHPGVVGVTLWGYLAGEHWKPNAYLLGRSVTVGNFGVGTAFQDYTVSGSGKLRVALTNDNTDNSRDLEVDYVIANGITYQAEDMAVNTGVWTGTCGGSFSPYLHCDGYIEFPQVSGSVTIRAKGTTGTEAMTVSVLDDTYERPALEWLRYEYFGNGTDPGPTGIITEAEGGVKGNTFTSTTRAGFSGTGYVTGFDAAGDYVEVSVNVPQAGSYPLVIRYASDASVARTIRLNGVVVKKNLSFPASTTFTDVQFTTNFNSGVNIIRLYVERGGSSGGDIDYFKVAGVSNTLSESDTGFPTYFPNPSTGSITFTAPADENHRSLIQIVDMAGMVVYETTLSETEKTVHTGLGKGVYIVRMLHRSGTISQTKLFIQF